MRDDKDFLSYKTYVYNFFNSSNFFNFTQVEPAKLELEYRSLWGTSRAFPCAGSAIWGTSRAFPRAGSAMWGTSRAFPRAGSAMLGTSRAFPRAGSAMWGTWTHRYATRHAAAPLWDFCVPCGHISPRRPFPRLLPILGGG